MVYLGKETLGKGGENVKAYQLKITLKDSSPSIWRRMVVPAGISFRELSRVLNEVMGWDGSHLYSFEFYNLGLRIEEGAEDGWGSWDVLEAAETVTDEFLDDVKRFIYIYDFGNDWQHTVEVEKILTDYDKNYPVVLEYKGDSPVEDGAPDGFPQIEYEREVLLAEIYQDYKKTELTELAKIHELGGYSKFKKTELIDFLVSNLLDRDVMCRCFTFLSDETLEIIKKFSDHANYGLASEEEIETAIPLIEGGYAGSHGFDIIVPKDVAEACKRNCDGEWKKLRREALELLYYLNGAAELYGICPIEKALEIYLKYTGKKIEELAVYDFCESVPVSERSFFIEGNCLVHMIFEDEDERERLEREQQGKEFYMPTKNEMVTLGKEGYLPFDESMKSLEAFLNIYWGDAPGIASGLCKYVQHLIRMGISQEEVWDDLEEKGILEELDDKTAEVTLHQLLAKAWQRTRKMRDRGTLPKGTARRERIHAVLSNSQEGNSIVKFPVDLNKKIYPNDPCPCGSGKKYKKCCGRNL